MGRLKVAPAALAGIVLCACGGSEPAASAGANFHIMSMRGEFHGTIAATTPTGSRSV